MGKKTLYEWSFLNKIRPLNLPDNSEDDFMLKKISLASFRKYLDGNKGKYIENELPIKPFKFLELRMYGLVPYNISKIQQGIQFDHAKDNYYLSYFNDKNCQNYINEWKTDIILNGGTSNEGTLIKQGFTKIFYEGTMQNHLNDLLINKIKVGIFREPDLNSMLSGIVFLADERVWKKELYPDYTPSPITDTTKLNEWGVKNRIEYNNWLDKIGGSKNEFLRLFLSDKKLA